MITYFAINVPKKEGGASTVELVIVLAFLLPILLGSMYLAKMIHAYISLVSAAHAGARAGAMMLRNSPSPQWQYDKDKGTITILNQADVESYMLEAAQAAMDPNKYELFSDKDEFDSVPSEIVCRCVIEDDEPNEYGEFLACNEAVCSVDPNSPRTYLQIHARLNAQLTLKLPFLPRESITLRSSSTMQAAEILEQ